MLGVSVIIDVLFPVAERPPLIRMLHNMVNGKSHPMLHTIFPIKILASIGTVGPLGGKEVCNSALMNCGIPGLNENHL
jgi:hypothetical protein